MSDIVQSMFLGFTFVTTAIYACKMSVLLFYRHIFFITEGYRRASLTVMVLSTAWFIAAQVANLLICQPIDSFWIRTKPGKCLNFNIMFIGTGIVDTVIDIFILLLPIRMALKLQLPRKTKVAVAGIFGLGGFVVITNIVRLRYIYQPNQKYGKSHTTPMLSRS
jgi:hydrogenase/urease accessory protein HupE